MVMNVRTWHAGYQDDTCMIAGNKCHHLLTLAFCIPREGQKAKRLGDVTDYVQIVPYPPEEEHMMATPHYDVLLTSQVHAARHSRLIWPSGRKGHVKLNFDGVFGKLLDIKKNGVHCDACGNTLGSRQLAAALPCVCGNIMGRGFQSGTTSSYRRAAAERTRKNIERCDGRPLRVACLLLAINGLLHVWLAGCITGACRWRTLMCT